MQAQVGEASDQGHESGGTGTIIDITVRVVDRQVHSINTQRSVRHLKTLLNGIPIEQQHIIYSGRVLQDDQPLSSYNIQNGDTLHLISTPPSVSSFASLLSRAGTSRSLGAQAESALRDISSYAHTHYDGNSPDTQQEGPNSLQILPQYLERMRHEYSVNGNDMHEMLRCTFSSFIPSQEEIPEREQLAKLLCSTRDMLINQTSQCLLELERDLRNNLNVVDPRVRHRTESNAQRSGRIFNKLGAYFLELARTMMQVEMGYSRSTTTVNIGAPLYITDDGVPNPLSIQGEGSTFDSTTISQIYSDLVNRNGTGLHQRRVPTEMIRAEADARSLWTHREIISILLRLLHHTRTVDETTGSFRNMPSEHEHDQASANIRQQNNTDMHEEEKNRTSLSPSGDVHVEEAATDGATTDNVTENMVTGVSSRPSTVEFRSAHESSIEPSDENIGTSLQ